MCSKFPWAIEYVGNQCINNKDLIQCATKNVKWVARFIKKYAESLHKIIKIYRYGVTTSS